MNQNLPELKKELIVQHLEEESVIIGFEGKVHHLRKEASLVFRLLESRCDRESALEKMGEKTLTKCLSQFRKLNFFEGGSSFSRRSVVKAGIAMPFVTTLLLPSPASAASGGAPTCTINFPTGSTEFTPITINFDTTDPDGDLLNLTFEYSTDGGAFFSVATPDVSSPLPNPAINIAAAAGLIFQWDNDADIGEPADVIFRITVDDGCNQSTCSTTFRADVPG